MGIIGCMAHQNHSNLGTNVYAPEADGVHFRAFNCRRLPHCYSVLGFYIECAHRREGSTTI